MKVDFSTVIASLIIGIPAFMLGVAGLVRAFKVDKTTAKHAVAAAHGSEVTQIIKALNQHIDNLQEDNRIIREGLDNVSRRLTACMQEREELQQQLRNLTDN